MRKRLSIIVLLTLLFSAVTIQAQKVVEAQSRNYYSVIAASFNDASEARKYVKQIEYSLCVAPDMKILHCDGYYRVAISTCPTMDKAKEIRKFYNDMFSFESWILPPSKSKSNKRNRR